MYASHCGAQVSSRNEKASTVIHTRAQCGLVTSHTPLKCLAGLRRFPHGKAYHKLKM